MQCYMISILTYTGTALSPRVHPPYLRAYDPQRSPRGLHTTAMLNLEASTTCPRKTSASSKTRKPTMSSQ